MDPLTAFAAIKSAISAGKQLHSMTKDIAGFFDAVDGAKSNHAKKKSSMFASSNEEAMDTFMKRQQAIDCEAELRELITQTRGFSQYQELLNLRKEIRLERKEQARLDLIKREEKKEMLMSIAGILIIIGAILGGSIAYLLYLDLISF